MTHDTEALRGLLAKVEAATGPDQVLDAHLVCALIAPPGSFVSIGPITGKARVCVGVNDRGADVLWGQWLDWIDTPLTGSIDASWALVEQVLPDWGGRVSFGPPSVARLWHRQYSDKTPASHDAPTPALAILGSLLTAALAQGAHHEA